MVELSVLNGLEIRDERKAVTRQPLSFQADKRSVHPPEQGRVFEATN